MSSQIKFRPIKPRLSSVGPQNAKDLVIGRAELVNELWRQLEAGSVRLVAERRMGKTWVLQLALATAPDGVVPVLFDAQKYTSVSELTLDLNRVLHEKGLLSTGWWENVRDYFRRGAHQMGGKKVHTSEVPEIESWSSLLEGTCADFVKKQAGKRAVLILDEFPFLLEKLNRDGTRDDATRLLDTLRSLRQALPELRMIFCGSLGLHIVLDKLRNAGYTGRPVNDMPPFEVPPLNVSDAKYLSGCLLLGTALPCSDISAVAEAIAKAGSGVPFYIQQLIFWMNGNRDTTWTPEQVERTPFELYDASGDPAEFRYYDDRLDQYYDQDVAAKCRAFLEVLSRHPEGQDLDTLLNLVRHNPRCTETDDHEAQRVLETLRDDHYLLSHGSRWRFKLEIVRQWWLHTRGGA